MGSAREQEGTSEQEKESPRELGLAHLSEAVLGLQTAKKLGAALGQAPAPVLGLLTVGRMVMALGLAQE